MILAALAIVATVAEVRVIDADTIEVSGTKVRLQGVAAPERGHPAYEPGRVFVQDLMAASDGVTCHLTGEISHNRKIGTCFVDDQDLSALVIAAGLARDCPRFSGGRYEAFETAASHALPLPGYCER